MITPPQSHSFFTWPQDAILYGSPFPTLPPHFSISSADSFSSSWYLCAGVLPGLNHVQILMISSSLVALTTICVMRWWLTNEQLQLWLLPWIPDCIPVSTWYCHLAINGQIKFQNRTCPKLLVLDSFPHQSWSSPVFCLSANVPSFFKICPEPDHF